MSSEDDARARDIKEALRRFSYGLYAVTARVQGEDTAMTANWICQCSKSPPMLVVAMETDSHTLALVRQSGRFCVSVYEASQRKLAVQISKPWARNPDKLAGVEVVETPSGISVPIGAVAWLECELKSAASVGDHVLVTALVTASGDLKNAEALTLLGSGFRYG